MADLLNLNDIVVEYFLKDASVRAVDHVSLTIPSDGYTLGVVGESGSGKSTLAMSIMNAIEPPGKITNGKIEFNGTNILKMRSHDLMKYRWEKVSMIYQSAMNSLNPVRNVRDPLVEVLRYHRGMSKSSAVDEAERLLVEVGLKTERARDYPHEFSGGMKQRVVIALALALGPDLLIADEPTSALDVVVTARILGLIKKEVNQHKRALIFITHEIAILRGLVDNLALMYSGEIVELGPLESILKSPLHPYTEMLLSTLLTFSSTVDQLALEEKEKSEVGPLVLSSLSQCRYVHRCKYAFQRCKVEKPHLVQVQDGRWVSCHKYT